jgi:kynurenine formamidase
VTIACTVAFAACTEAPRFYEGRIIDLTHAFDEQTIFWPTEEGFQLHKRFEGYTPNGYYYAANTFCTAEHGGTHVDAPIHFHEGRRTVDELPLENLMGEGIVIDVSQQCSDDRDYQIVIEDFSHWENLNGQIPDGSIVLLRTGFGKHWPDRVKYMGTDERGGQAVQKLHFPGLHPETARWLVNSRSIKAIGLDTPSIDYGRSTHFESHVTLFAHNIPVFENVAGLDQLPPKGFSVIALPMKIKGGSGGPLRIIAILDKG